MKETTYNFTNGRFLGYPKCCIEAFGDIAIPFAMRPELTRKAAVNGFLPCVECAKKLLSGKITYEELINPNRKCTVPFTTNPTFEQDLQIDFELNQL